MNLIDWILKNSNIRLKNWTNFWTPVFHYLLQSSSIQGTFMDMESLTYSLITSASTTPDNLGLSDLDNPTIVKYFLPGWMTETCLWHNDISAASTDNTAEWRGKPSRTPTCSIQVPKHPLDKKVQYTVHFLFVLIITNNHKGALLHSATSLNVVSVFQQSTPVCIPKPVWHLLNLNVTILWLKIKVNKGI